MRFNRLTWPLFLIVSITAAGVAADKDEKSTFTPKPIGAYSHRQTSEKVTIAVQPFENDNDAHQAFGKINPWRLGILPVLVIVQNDGPDAIRIDQAKFVYELPDGSKVEATPASDIKYLNGAKEPGLAPGGPIGMIHKKGNPLAEWEIEGRAFAAKMIPAGQSASGFVYFQPPLTSAAASVYITGLKNPVTGKELFYFEIPLSGN